MKYFLIVALMILPNLTFAAITLDMDGNIQSTTSDFGTTSDPGFQNTGWGGDSYNLNTGWGGDSFSSNSESRSGNLRASTFQELVVNFIVTISNMVIRLLVALSLVVFLYGLMKFMFKGQGSDSARLEGRKLMIWGIIGLFVITSVWGIIALFSGFIGHTDVGVPQFRK